MKINNCGHTVEVKDYEEASRVIRAKIDSEFMGAEEWYSYPDNGSLYDGNKLIGRISFNGNFWPVMAMCQ